MLTSTAVGNFREKKTHMHIHTYQNSNYTHQHTPNDMYTSTHTYT